MWKGAGLGAGFLIASVCGVALGLLIPPLLPFALLGIALGISPLLFRWIAKTSPVSWFGASRNRQFGLIAAICVAVAGVGATVTLTASHSQTSSADVDVLRSLPRAIWRDGGHPSLHQFIPPLESAGEGPHFRLGTLAIGVTYTGEAVQKGDPDRLELIDRLQMRRSSFRPTPGALHRLARGLRVKHWRPVEEGGGGIVLRRRRQLLLRSRIFPPETGNTIILPRIVFDDPGSDVTMKLRFDRASRLTLLADPETFGPSYPQGVREARPASGLEQVAIPVGELGTVEVDVRSPLFRNELLGSVADLTIPGIFKWLLGFLATALIALFNDEIKERLKLVLRRLRPRLGSATG